MIESDIFLPERERLVYRSSMRELQDFNIRSRRGEVLEPAKPVRPAPQPFQEVARQAAARCDKLLKILAPEAAISAWFHAKSSAVQALSELTIIERFLWVLAACATGDSRDPQVLDRFFLQAGRWWSGMCASEAFSELDESVPFAVAGTPGREFLMRSNSQAVRYHWISGMICTEIGRQIENDDTFSAALPDFTIANVERCFAVARGYGRDPYGHSLDVVPTATPGMELARHVAIGAGGLAGQGFETVASSAEKESRPWVEFADGFVPIGLGTIMRSMERPLISAVDRLLNESGLARTHKLNKGELYERVAQACITLSFRPAPTSALARPYSIRITADDDGRDIDLAIIDHSVEIIGETKAMEIPASIKSAASAFDTQLKKIVQQLEIRLEALRRGEPLIDGAGTRHKGSNNTIAIGVVLHLYSASLCNPGMLELLPKSVVDERIAIADLHSWIAILSMMQTFGELREYLRYRSRLLSLGVTAIEECDFAVAFLNPDRERLIEDYRLLREAHDSDRAMMLLNGVSISAEISHDTPRPTNPRVWRQQFYAAADVGPPPLGQGDDGS